MFLRQFRKYFRVVFESNQKHTILRDQRVFASNFKRSPVADIPLDQDLQIMEKFKENRRLSKDEWDEFVPKILGPWKFITKLNVDTTIMKYCHPCGQLDIGKSYIEYLKQSGIEPNLATWGNFFKLYSLAREHGVKLTNEDLKDISDLYKNLLNKYTVFDPKTCEYIISALVLTEDWRKSLDLIEMIKIISKPSGAAYSFIVTQAFRVGDADLGWKLLHEMRADGKVPRCDALVSYISYFRKNQQTFHENVEKILTFISENEIVVSEDVAYKLHGAFNDFGINSCVTPITRGKCMSCNKLLRDVALTDAEFQQLSEKMLHNVLIGKNIFLKSSPHEVANFVKFVDKTRPYDIVIDGLNVAFGNGLKSNVHRSKFIASVVSHFAVRRKKVLVVGRKHMLGWPAAEMIFIRKNSHLFLADDLSQDDPFFLYAALKSGPNTDIISRDLLRSQAFLLDHNLKPIFRRWQRQHQFALGPKGERVHTFGPLKFITHAHQISHRVGYVFRKFKNDGVIVSYDSYEQSSLLLMKRQEDRKCMLRVKPKNRLTLSHIEQCSRHTNNL